METHHLSAVPGGDDLALELDPQQLLEAFTDLADPRALAVEVPRMFSELAQIPFGSSGLTFPVKDKRFADPTWQDNPLYRSLGQAYLAWSQAIERLADNPHLDWRRQARAHYLAQLLTSSLAPTNWLAGNPAALKHAVDTRGLSLLRGTGNVVRDLVTNGGLPSTVDARPFTVGDNLAVTPGAVVHREEMFELLQYSPSTPTVRTRPLLMVPPQVNKHYILDLAPGRSLVEYAVGEGIQFFTIVWRNPRDGHGHWDLEDYVAAQLRAVDIVSQITGSEDVNLLGACAGGLTSALMLGHLAARGDRRVHAATLAIAMIDTRYPNLLCVLANERMRTKIGRDAGQSTVYDSKVLMRQFALMRPGDLVFNYVVNNWLLGQDAPAFDILAWNADATNLAAAFDHDLMEVYADNAAAEPGRLTLLGTPIDLSQVDCDTFIVAGHTDHITPWKPCYMTSQLLGGYSEVVITSTGHIQTIVNPPGKPRASFWTGPAAGPDPQVWLEQATRHEGSWWPMWAQWLLARSGAEKAAPATLGSTQYPAGVPAPGTYVLEK